MVLQKTFQERVRRLTLTWVNASSWYALLFDSNQSSYTFTAATTDLLTATEHNFVNGTRVTVSNSGGSLPAGLTSGIEYRVIGVSESNFNLCLNNNYDYNTKTGTPIDITGTGSGTNTVTEQPLSAIDDLNVWVRHEVNYQGSGRQPMIIPSAIKDWANNLTYIGPISIQFTPTSASIIYRYFGVITGGIRTVGNSTGTLVGTEDLVISQTILPGSPGTPGVGKNFNYTISL